MSVTASVWRHDMVSVDSVEEGKKTLHRTIAFVCFLGLVTRTHRKAAQAKLIWLYVISARQFVCVDKKKDRSFGGMRIL